VLGILVAVLAAGCAGGEALSKEQYVSKLNAMCREFSAKEKEIGDHPVEALKIVGGRDSPNYG